MKLTTKKLKQIIREELEAAMETTEDITGLAGAIAKKMPWTEETPDPEQYVEDTVEAFMKSSEGQREFADIDEEDHELVIKAVLDALEA